MFRGEFDGAVDRLRARLETSEGKEKLSFEKDVGGASVWDDEAGFQSGLFTVEGS